MMKKMHQDNKLKRDVQAVHINSRQRNRGEDASEYTLKLPSPIYHADSIQIGSVNLPIQSIHNISEPYTHIPIGIPLEIPEAFMTESLDMGIEVRWMGVSPADAQSRIRHNSTPQLSDFRMFESWDIEICLPRRLNKIISIQNQDPYIRIQTEKEHCMDIALKHYRSLGLGIRIAGSLLTNGIPELIPSYVSLMDIDINLLTKLILIVDDFTLDIHVELLKKYIPVCTACSDNEISNVIEALSGDLSFAETIRNDFQHNIGELYRGSIYLHSDMPTLSECLFILNHVLDDLNKKAITFPIPDFLQGTIPSRTPFASYSTKVLPDRLCFGYDISENYDITDRESVVFQWCPTNELTRSILLHDPQTNNINKKISNAQHVGQELLIFPIYVLKHGSLYRWLGFPNWKPNILLSNITSLHKPCRTKQHALESVTIDSETCLTVELLAGKLSGDYWRRDIQLRPGKYISSSLIADNIKDRGRGLTWDETENREFILLDYNRLEKHFFIAAGSYYTEQFRQYLQYQLCQITGDENFMVEYISTMSQTLEETNTAQEQMISTFSEQEGYPRQVRWQICHRNGIPFGFRSNGTWMRKIGFMRNVYRGQSFYTSDEYSFDCGFRFDISCSVINDSERNERLRLTTDTLQFADETNSGFHRAMIQSDTSVLFDSSVWYSFLNVQQNFSYSLGRARQGDLIIVHLPPIESCCTNRILTLVVKESIHGSDLKQWLSLVKSSSSVTQSKFSFPTCFFPTPSTSIISSLIFKQSLPLPTYSEETVQNFLWIEPYKTKIQLLFGLDKSKSAYAPIGFSPIIYPQNSSLIIDNDRLRTIPSGVGGIGRNESILNGIKRYIYGGYNDAHYILDKKCLSSSSQDILGISSIDELLSDAELIENVAKITSRVKINTRETISPLKTALLLFHSLNLNVSGVGGSCAQNDGRELSSSVFESPLPVRLDEPYCIYLQIRLPGSDYQAINRYRHIHNGSDGNILTKFMINSKGYQNVNEQILHRDLTRGGDIQTLLIEWLMPDGRHVQWNGMEHEITLIFTVQDQNFAIA